MSAAPLFGGLSVSEARASGGLDLCEQADLVRGEERKDRSVTSPLLRTPAAERAGRLLPG